MERRTQSRRGTAQALSWVVPLVKVAISIFLVLILTPGLPIDPSSSEQLWAGAELVAAVTTLWFPAVGAIASIPVLWVMPHYAHVGLGLVLICVTAVMAAVRWPWRAVYVLAAVHAVTLLNDLIIVGSSGRTVLAAGVVVVSYAIGVWIRFWMARQRRGESRIEASTRIAEQARERERSALAGELAKLLLTSLQATHRSLLRAGSETDPVVVRRVLTRIGSDSRTALSRLRLLVTTLRAHTAGGGDVDLDATLDWFEDELVSHGHQVEWERRGETPAEVPAVVSTFLRVLSERLVRDAPAGSLCELDVTASAGGIRIEVGAQLHQEAGPPNFTTVAGRAEDLGGTLEVSAGTSLHAVLDVPLASAQTSRLPHFVAHLSQAQRIVAAVSLFGLAIACGMTLTGLLRTEGTWQGDLQWVLTFGAVLLSVWRPWTGIALLAVEIALSYAFVGGDFWIGSPHAIAALALTVILSARAPVVAPLLIGGWALLTATTPWPSEISAFEGALVGVPAVIFGLGNYFFVTVRARQEVELERLEHDRLEQQLEERRHLASELHDVVAHQLSLIAMYLTPSALEDEQVGDTVEQLTRTTDSALTDLTALLHTLQGAPGASAGWSAREAVEGVIRTLEEAGHRVTLALTADLELVDATTQRTLARVVREAATNALRYAPGDSPVHIVLGVENATATVRVTSDLAALPRVDPYSTGSGLVGLRERVELTNGRFSAGEVGDHWVVEAQLPAHAVRV